MFEGRAHPGAVVEADGADGLGGAVEASAVEGDPDDVVHRHREHGQQPLAEADPLGFSQPGGLVVSGPGPRAGIGQVAQAHARHLDHERAVVQDAGEEPAELLGVAVGGTDELPEQVAACSNDLVGRPGVTAGIGDVAPRRLEHGRVDPAGAEHAERGLRCGAGGGWV